MRVNIFDNIKHDEKSTAIETLVKNSTPFQTFYFMVILSVIMATIGLMMNNIAIIIGSMLIAPVLYPLLGLAMGVVMADGKLILRSFGTFIKSSIIGLGAALFVSLLMIGPANSEFTITPEILIRTVPSLPDASIAIIAGLAASFALVKPNISETLPGVAIAVALVPPLATAGIGITSLSWSITSGAFILFLTNALGITFAAVIVFSIMNFYVKRNIAIEAVKKEDKELQKENDKGKNKEEKDKKGEEKNKKDHSEDTEPDNE